MTAKIPLQNGDYVIVDKEDYERCMEYTWYWNNNSKGVYRNVIVPKGRGVESLSEFIIGREDGSKNIIRINLSLLDYRKENLKEIDLSKKLYRSRPRNDNTSGYKGVSWNKALGKWQAYISIDGNRKHIGYFIDKDEAAKAYNQMVETHVGELGYLNIIGIDNRAREYDDYDNDEGSPQRRRKYTYYKGVRFNHGKFASKVIFEGKSISIGNFNTSEQAAKAYDKKAYELYGDKAILNFPELINEYKNQVTQ